jgi:hypothetical protein
MSNTRQQMAYDNTKRFKVAFLTETKYICSCDQPFALIVGWLLLQQ